MNVSTTTCTETGSTSVCVVEHPFTADPAGFAVQLVFLWIATAICVAWLFKQFSK